MDWLMYAFILVFIILITLIFILLKIIEKDTLPNGKVNLPYKRRDDFLSAVELHFYRSLAMHLENKAVICPKVGVKELVFINNGVGKDYMKFFNYIAKKHIDFVLCDARNMQVICAVELDDKSHQKESRKQRDDFIDQVFVTAQIPLFHVKAQSGYTKNDIINILNCVQSAGTNCSAKSAPIANKIETTKDNNLAPTCPKCGIRMVTRKATRGKNAGKEFYGCPNYPKCREVKEI